MIVTVYTTTTCPYCDMLTDYLDQKGVTYTKKLVDDDELARNEMMKISEGFLGVPYTTIEDGRELHKVIGFDKLKLESVFTS